MCKVFSSVCVPWFSACNCDSLGSSSLVCDVTTGQCPCLPNVANASESDALGGVGGLQCGVCIQDYFGKHTGQGCQPCMCDNMVSTQWKVTGIFY